MRVTQSMLSNNMIRNISNSYERLAKLQEQILTQKKFSKPSDDPVAAMMGMNYRTSLNQVEQYSRNISEATNWVESTDSALGQAISALQRMRELTVQASNGTYESDQRDSVNEEIKQLRQHLVDIGDTQLGGKYIFNGYDTNKRPSDTMVDGAPSYGTDEIQVEVFTGIKIPINTSGQSTFGEALKTGGTIDQLMASLKSTDEADITNRLAELDETINVFIKEQAKVGAKQNRIDLMTDRVGQQEVFAQKILSSNEDVDMEKVILDFTTQESIHTASLSVGAKVIQPSLLDFLR
ncbi:flagellar hook-associated protein FlgL [Peribacillus asahii]|uniref:Flagellar hook-associated protein FlgL n=1 Tax=Peribacillus asahii TaxID=228899 RepID=A0A398B4E8_9BACI|nr:flagellar hook-associated protein FlgL [Peribacillus asahii]RID84785.1 flagellar hook-associated protein FlgL [Peribacillus asahii]